MNELVLLAFLFLKTGEKFATQETAGPAVTAFTSHVAEQMGGMQFAPRVFNQPKKAVEFVVAKKPVVGIVTPGFYLTYAGALHMTPLLETKRAGVPAEQFVVVARPDTAADPTGQIIGTTLADEERYVLSVVLGREARLQPVADVEQALFDLAEGKGGLHAILVETATWKLFAADPDLAKSLKPIHESPVLPGNLVVAFADWPKSNRLKDALLQMSHTEEGRKVLASIRVEAFVEVNQDRLQQAEKLFHGR